MDRRYETQGEDELCRAVWWENLKEEDRLEDQSFDKGLTLKIMLKIGLQVVEYIHLAWYMEMCLALAKS